MHRFPVTQMLGAFGKERSQARHKPRLVRASQTGLNQTRSPRPLAAGSSWRSRAADSTGRLGAMGPGGEGDPIPAVHYAYRELGRQEDDRTLEALGLQTNDHVLALRCPQGTPPPRNNNTRTHTNAQLHPHPQATHRPCLFESEWGNEGFHNMGVLVGWISKRSRVQRSGHDPECCHTRNSNATPRSSLAHPCPLPPAPTAALECLLLAFASLGVPSAAVRFLHRHAAAAGALRRTLLDRPQPSPAEAEAALLKERALTGVAQAPPSSGPGVVGPRHTDHEPADHPGGP